VNNYNSRCIKITASVIYKNLIKTEKLTVDESFAFRKSKGNGRLRRQIWCNSQGEVTRYSLTYINHHHFSGDNDRVLGYDNAHSYHHRHYMGEIEPVNCKSFAAIRKKPDSISGLAHKLHRSRAAIDKDVQLLESVGIVVSEYIVNPGHGRCRIIRAMDSEPIKLHVEALV
jgi:hypothetical protein